MTAEIALLNRSAIALAADSAVTIGRGANVKIYNTVDKIFELSEHEPVGIMVYGGLNFMGLPIETVVKSYRKRLGATAFSNLYQYRDDFRNYLATEVPVDDQDKATNVILILFSAIEGLAAEIREAILERASVDGFKKSKTNGIAQEHIRRRIAELKSEKFTPGFKSVRLPADYAPLVDAVVDDSFKVFKPTEQTKALLRTFAGYALAKAPLSDSSTGIVVAGFGTDDLCPALERFEMDGLVSGRLRYVDFASVKINRQSSAAEILGFAQEDMVKTFVDGVNPEITDYFETLVEAAVDDTARSVLGASLQGSALTTAVAAIQDVLDRTKDDLKKKASDHVTRSFSKPVKDMIRVMPKRELATLAESLIEITSLRRKVTRDKETVGGDVDVAIISKSEGFIWTKRKHYFSKELNPRFFVRHYVGSQP